MKVILDTNFLIDVIRFKVDLNELAGNELFVLSSSIKEIEKIIKRGTKEATLAKLALDFIKKSSIKILDTDEEVDKALILYSNEYAIATHDRILKDKLKKKGAKLIYIRQKRYLVVE